MSKRSCLIISIWVIALLLVACSGGSNSKLQEQLDLGQKYLAEADYENALIAFETAIEIDDKCVEAYIGAADAYIGLGQPEKAREILNIGFEKTGDDRLGQEIKKREEILVSLEEEKYLLLFEDIRKIFNSGDVIFLCYLTYAEKQSAYGSYSEQLEEYIIWVIKNKPDLLINRSSHEEKYQHFTSKGLYSLSDAYCQLIRFYLWTDRLDDVMRIREMAADFFNDSEWITPYADEKVVFDKYGRVIQNEYSIKEYDGAKGFNPSKIIYEDDESGFKYDSSGRLIESYNKSSVHYYEYNGTGTVIEKTISDSGYEIEPFIVEYDRFGRILSRNY